MRLEEHQPWRLLILDGHGSHASIKFMRICLQNRIQLLYLPPHSSHILQPCDVGVFAPVKRRYRNELSKLNSLLDLENIPRHIFVKAYSKIRPIGMSKANIISGWSQTGIYPLNPLIPLSSDQLKSASVLEVPEQSDTVELLPKSSLVEPGSLIGLSERESRLLARDLNAKMATILAENAVLKSEKASLQVRLDTLEPQKRKRVNPVDSNSKFVGIEQIRDSQLLAALEAEEEDARKERKRKRAENAARNTSK
jgi:DDE superfamily endonuclease